MTTPLPREQPNFKRGSCQTVSHRTRSWRSAQADIVERTGLEKEETAVVSNRHLVLLNLKGASERGQYLIDGKHAEFIRRKPGAVLFVPAGCHWRGWEVGASTAAYLLISIEPTLVSRLCTEMSSHPMPPLSPDLGFQDPIIMNAARGIGAEIDDGNPISTMLTESYIATIFAQLLRKQRYVAPSRKGGLTTTHLNRIVELIDEDLTAELSLSHLAERIGLSVPHFCRAFRQTVGCPPHTFIVRRRIERAQDQLRGTALPITEISIACGFSSSSHFSNAFKRFIGTTPLDYRQSWPVKATD
jgi:AraC-like DNA-binding protein